MFEDDSKRKIFFIKRRIVLIKFFYFSAILIIFLRLLKLQIFDYLLYKKKSENNYMRMKFFFPKRGIIFDRNMVKIADVKIRYRVLYFFKKKDYVSDIKKIYSLLDLKEKEINKNLSYFEKQINKKNSKKHFILAKNLSFNEIKRLKFNKVYIPNMVVEDYCTRYYPFNNYTSILIGYVGKILSNFDFRAGLCGIEKTMDSILSGNVGDGFDIVNSVGKKIDEIVKNEPIDGENIVTTINQDLQNELSKLFDGKSGAATLIDVRTGEILAMVSSPNIDPNVFSDKLFDNEWQEIETKIKKNQGLFLNKNIEATYPPGSTFKIVSSLAGILNGINPKKKYNCTGKYKIGDRVFHCWKDVGHGLVDLEDAIVKSCNCYFYNLSQKIDSKEIYNVAERLGLCSNHLPDFNNELTGFVGYSELVKKKYNKKWFSGDNANLFIGQGYLSLTPLQLAIMIARVATNKNVEPCYLFNHRNNNFDSLGYDDKYLKIIRKALFSCINNNKSYSYVNKKYQICGKTGSSQIISKRIETSKDASIKQMGHALFVGYAPFNNPKYAVSVIVEHGFSGATGAAPIGTSILSTAIKMNS